MVIIITASRKGIRAEEVSQHDYNTMLTALRWKTEGKWEDVKRFVHKADRIKSKGKRFWK